MTVTSRAATARQIVARLAGVPSASFSSAKVRSGCSAISAARVCRCGSVTVYTIPAEINWAVNEVLAPGVQSVAALPDYPEAQSIYFILPGDALFDGSPSPNLRISLFTENNNDLGTYHRMTEDGHRLYDAAIYTGLVYTYR